MEHELDNYADDKVIDNEPCTTGNKQGSVHNFIGIKHENIDDVTVVATETELYCTDKVCLSETVISGGHIKQEPCGGMDEQASIQNYLSIKDENVDDLTVAAEETELMTDDIDNKVCVYETVISGGCIKEEPSDMEDEPGMIDNNINMKACGECGEKYDLYCLKCPMLIRIFDSNHPDGRDNTVRWTLPKVLIDINETPSCVGIVALRTIPKGVVFGPFKGLNSIKRDTISKWKLKHSEVVYTKGSRWSNWMRYVKKADQSFRANLIPFQFEDELYYRSERCINVGDELLVCWASGSAGSRIQDAEDSYLEPPVCEKLDDTYACTFCCVGYKSISHLKAHNSICPEKRNQNDFCKEIVVCDICKIYLDKKEYSDYHIDRCYRSNGKCELNPPFGRNRDCRLRRRIHKDDRPFSCILCPYKTKRKSDLKKHIALHDGDKPFACILCPYKAMSNSKLKQHVAIHNGDKQFECTLCPFATTHKSTLTRHMDTHNSDKPFACTLCPYKTARKSSLKRHVAVHNDDKPFACALCPYKAKRKLDLKKHIATHDGDKSLKRKATRKSNLKEHIAGYDPDRPFACTLCSYKTAKKSTLNRHIAIHKDDKPFACTLCPYKTARKSSLKRHIAVHNDDKPFACTFCAYRTTTKWTLNEHIAGHNGARSFACTLCPYKAKKRLDLKKHIAAHDGDESLNNKSTKKSNLKGHIVLGNGDYRLACTLCPFKATTNWNLKRHIAFHNGDRPFACTLCPYKAKTNSNLKLHVAFHKGDKPFACTLCPYKATTSSTLKLHVAAHNGDKPFACTLCPYKATVSSNLKRHIATHNGDRPFPCTLCSYKATTKCSLRRHVAAHDNDKSSRVPSVRIKRK